MTLQIVNSCAECTICKNNLVCAYYKRKNTIPCNISILAQKFKEETGITLNHRHIARIERIRRVLRYAKLDVELDQEKYKFIMNKNVDYGKYKHLRTAYKIGQSSRKTTDVYWLEINKGEKKESLL